MLVKLSERKRPWLSNVVLPNPRVHRMVVFPNPPLDRIKVGIRFVDRAHARIELSHSLILDSKALVKKSRELINTS